MNNLIIKFGEQNVCMKAFFQSSTLRQAENINKNNKSLCFVYYIFSKCTIYKI